MSHDYRILTDLQDSQTQDSQKFTEFYHIYRILTVTGLSNSYLSMGFLQSYRIYTHLQDSHSYRIQTNKCTNEGLLQHRILTRLHYSYIITLKLYDYHIYGILKQLQDFDSSRIFTELQYFHRYGIFTHVYHSQPVTGFSQ